ncbi:alpha-amylase family protein [Halorussus sp. MSC15.2]|uniref:alpha-amylase family protein n=1 Tax=Halorussus sp. MSC15.2 TaxID=2283638 RepID=UPI0013D60F30|nr:alpha-amylase family protein [Halorussus sp. MSC15.2]NEU58401.1 trehalose synthase [Halorussus sp. MSC15.2]
MGGSDHWYKNSVVYAVDVKRFDDSDGDGVGDFHGLTDRLDYLSRLGVDCIWLLPFFPSPMRDNGYDVADYYGIDDRLGTLGDFAEFLHGAENRGIRVLVDLVVNHTSDQHPWFQKAREDPDSKYRDYYAWTDDPESASVDAETIFPGQEESVWTYDEVADAYYFHRFYDYEPGLNLSNPDVRQEIRNIMGFWLRLGVDGFRLDAASHMVEAKGLESTRPDDPHGIVRNFRSFVTKRKGDAVLLGEVDEEPRRLGEFFGDGDELNLLFNFLLDNYLFLGLARENVEPVVEGLRLLPSVPTEGQWLNFLRNLDELDLERLTESERRDVFEAFAPEENMRIFGRGIRRRLAPMLDDGRQLRLAYSLLFSLPGTPMVVYGDEIGMGDDLSLAGRDAVRTPMQWSSEVNAGFSDAPAEQLVAPVVDEGEYGYENVNVLDQQFDPDSLFNWVQRLVHLRKQNPEVGWGEFDLVETTPPGVMVHRCTWDGRSVVAVHNLADEETTVSFELPETTQLVDMFADRDYEPLDGTTHEFAVSPYGYRWLRGARGEPSRFDEWDSTGQ